MRTIVLSILAFLALTGTVQAQYGGYRHHGGTTIGIFGGYGTVQTQPAQPAYGYRNIPFDGRYPMSGSHRPNSVVGNYFGCKDGDYLNPLSGTVGNAYRPTAPEPKRVTNPFCSPSPAFQAIQGTNGQWRVIPVE
jgi:hypothetical protein